MVEVRLFAPADLGGVIALCAAENWPSFPEDPARALRALTAPGVTLAAGTVLNRSAVVNDPVCAKSWVLRLVTGTPTAAVP